MTEQPSPASEQAPAHQGTHSITLREARNFALLSAFFTAYGVVNLAAGLSQGKWMYAMLGATMLLLHVPALMIRCRQYRQVRCEGPLTIALPPVRPASEASIRVGRVVLWTAIGLLTLLTAAFDLLAVSALFVMPNTPWGMKVVLLVIAAVCTVLTAHYIRRAVISEQDTTEVGASEGATAGVPRTSFSNDETSTPVVVGHWWTDTGTREEIIEARQGGNG